jgi:hypothetical protein
MRTADFVILGWFPFSLVLFTLLRPRHAVLAAYLGAWLFLPMRAGLVLPVLPDIDKVTAASFAVVMGVMLFDTARVFTFRFRWFDIPMAIWCFAPFMSAITNNLGAWEGMSAVLEQFTLFGIPYYLGRIYFNDWEGFRELGVAIFIGGVIYVPLCLIEIKMSPQLHRWIYGYHQHEFAQTIRFGGYRPMVFMQHGLAVGFWMTAASLVGLWLLVTGSMRHLLGVPMILIVPVLLVTTVMCKAAAGIGFLFAGIATLFAIKWTKTALPLYALILVAPVYMVARTSGAVDGTKFVEWATDIFGPNRAQSLETRMKSENVLSAHALKRGLWGYGRFTPGSDTPAWMPRDEETGRRAAIPDGMWVITLSVNGLVGLVSLTTAILLPPLLLRKRVPPGWWAHPMAAPAAACAVLLVLHMCDNLLNAMVNPIFICAIGGLSALGTRATQPLPQPRGFPVQPMQRQPLAAARRPIVAPPPQPQHPARAGVGMRPAAAPVSRVNP